MSVKSMERWGTVSRLTVDLESGSYSLLTQILADHNARRQPRDVFLTKAALMRGLVGTWMKNHPLRTPTAPSLVEVRRDR